MSKKTYALIGAGMMGREHFANLALLPEAKLIAFADPDEGSRQESAKAAGPDVAVYSDYMDMMRQAQPDAVIISSPNFTHRKVVEDIRAFNAALLIEKPLATTIEDAQALMSMAEDYPNLLEMM